MKRHVLFVSDDAQVLSTLESLVKPMEREWLMHFAPSGQEALAWLRSQPVEVMVTALAMAGISGGQVLHEAQELQPTALRIALSVPADRDQVAQNITTIHQALSFPFDLDQLLAMVANAGHLARAGVDPAVTRYLGQIENLPSVPGLYRELCRALENEETTVRQVGEIVRQDVGMTVKILQLVNSAFFGLRRSVPDIQDAVAFLGTDTIKALVLVHGVFDQVGLLGTQRLSLVDVWRHSLSVAKGARALAAMEGLSRPLCAEAFLGGMLHDVGILVLAKGFPERYDRVVERVQTQKVTILSAEKKEFGLAHPEVGAFLLGMWGIQPAVLESVSLHHAPNSIQSSSLNPLLAVHLADVLCGTPGHHILFENSSLDGIAIDGLGLRERIAGWRQVLSRSGW
ncbi:MAG: response regulator [Holophaga sp.]|nr:response regulator [Holophaga sp.]